MSTDSCLFCRIASGETDTTFVLQSSLSVVFLDINPVRPGHALIVPRRHAKEFCDLTDEELLDSMRLARRVAHAQRKLFAPKRVGLFAAGFDVAHAHMHVLPLYEYHDLTSQVLLEGKVRRAEPAELQSVYEKYAEQFAAEG